MRGKHEPASELYDSPFAMTILPGKAVGKPARRARKSDAAETFSPADAPLTPAQFAPTPEAAVLAMAAPQPFAAPAPAFAPSAPDFAPTMHGQAAPAGYPIDYPAAPGFPQQPHYTGGERSGDYPPPAPGTSPQSGQPGIPPAGYAPLNFLDDPNQAPEPKKSNRRLVMLIAVPVVLALAGGGYVMAPKLLGNSTSAKPVTIAFPAKIGTLAKQTDPKTLAFMKAALTPLRAQHPALANVNVALYGPSNEIGVVGGLLPTSVVAKTPAQQAALIAAVNKAAADPETGPEKLKVVAQPDTKGQLWCAFPAAGSPAESACIWVDQQALVLMTVPAKSASAGITQAQRVLAAVEHH